MTAARTQQRPAILPTSFKVLKTVQNGMKIRRSGPRSRGFHPSEMAKLCPVKFSIYEQALDNFAHPDNEVRAKAMATVHKILNTKHDGATPNMLPSHINLDVEIGTAIHIMTQHHLGKHHLLWGAWSCCVCGFKVEGFMPRSTEPGVDGIPAPTPAPCPQCRGKNLGDRWPWHYIEPHVHVPEWDIEGHTDGLFVPIHNGERMRFILEIKSINEAGYQEKYGPPLPRPDHVAQASIYAWAWGIEKIYFIYVNKNALRQWKEFLVDIDMTAVAHAQRKMSVCLEARRTKQLPIAHRVCEDIEHRIAVGCPVVEECWGRRPPINFFAGDPFEV